MSDHVLLTEYYSPYVSDYWKGYQCVRQNWQPDKVSPGNSAPEAITNLYKELQHWNLRFPITLDLGVLLENPELAEKAKAFAATVKSILPGGITNWWYAEGVTESTCCEYETGIWGHKTGLGIDTTHITIDDARAFLCAAALRGLYGARLENRVHIQTFPLVPLILDVEPVSALTLQRPQMWQRAITVATKLTRYFYPPRPSGFTDCGGEEEPGRIIATQRAYVPEGAMEWLLHEVGHWVAATPEERLQPNYGLVSERGDSLGRLREWQAWAFEEIILAPFGPARSIAPPSQRDGVGFSKAGPMPEFALHHAERQIRELRLEVEEWRSIYGEWINWQSTEMPV